jgi:outer membrane protein assembly factor BamB
MMHRSMFYCLAMSACFATTLQASDWTHWRGPEGNGVSRETNLPDRMGLDPKDPDSNLVWKQPFGGRSCPIIMNGHVYIINEAGSGITDQERVMCFDEKTGKQVWEHRFNVFQTDIVSNRVGWSTLAGDPETGNIYAHGIQGLFFCYDKDGKVLWSHSLTEEYGRISGYGGRINSPIVDGELVIMGLLNASWGDQARGGNRFVAFNKRTGAVVWWSEMLQSRGTFYSIPIVKVINGERLLLTGASDGALHAFKVHTGEHAWAHPLGARAMNAGPVVDGSLVYASHGEENEDTNVQGRVICVDASKIEKGKPKLVWKVDGIKGGFETPILHEGRLYVADDKAMLYCLDAKTGKQIWKFKYGKTARGSPVMADGKIYVCEVASRFHILKPGPKKCEELHSQFFPSADGTVVELNGTPAVANGRIFFNTRDELYCIGKKDYTPTEAKVPTPTAEPVVEGTGKPTHLQVIPADVVLAPGESVTFEARLFDDKGRFLRKTTAKWTLPNPTPPPPAPTPPGAKPAPQPPQPAGPVTLPPALVGTVSEDGTFKAAAAPPFQQGSVAATADGVTGKARVRILPPLPFAANFERVPLGRVPAAWVNCTAKFVMVKHEGATVMKKLGNNSNPLIARAYTYFGMPTLSDYTLEADLQGTKVRNDLPDMGIVNSRYTLMLDGNKQQLRLMSWEANPRLDKGMSFPWKPNTWYHVKLSVTPAGDKAFARGKVWPKGAAEPEAWTIEFEDPCPNLSGSPALYGYSTGILNPASGTEILYTNVKATPNKK